MTRLVKQTAKSPSEVKTKSGDSVWICRCGLSSNEKGLCDGSHQKVQDEAKDKLYMYKKDKSRYQVAEPKAF